MKKRVWILLRATAGLILIYIFLARPYHMRWGANEAELDLALL